MPNPTPLETTVAATVGNIHGVPGGLPDLPIGGFTSTDFSQYSLRIKSVFVIDLADADDRAKFDANSFVYDESEFRGGYFSDLFGITDPTFDIIDLADYDEDNTFHSKDFPSPKAEYLYSDSQISWDDFLRVVRYALQVSGSTASQYGYYGIVFECIPFVTKEIRGHSINITAVNSMIDFVETQMAANYIDAMCSSSNITFPVRPEIILVAASDVGSYGAKKTVEEYADIIYDGNVPGLCNSVEKSHIGGFKINKAADSDSATFDNVDGNSLDKIFGHQSYLAELAFHHEEQSIRNSKYGEGSSNYGGYHYIILNTEILTANYHMLIHEIGHAITPHFQSYGDFNPHLDPKGGHNMQNANVQEVYKEWRGFGNGVTSAFGSAKVHPSPDAGITNVLFSCPLVYLVGSDLAPMPSSNIMGYPNSHVLGAGSLYNGASYLGADVGRYKFPIVGQVFKYEVFCAVVGEAVTPEGHQNMIKDDANVFLIFDSTKLIDSFNKVKSTRRFFIKSQILWGGIQPRQPTKSAVIDFLRYANPERRLDQEALFYDLKNNYDNSSYTQKEEYEIPYADKEAEANNIDYFKRDANHINRNHYNVGIDADAVTSHVSDEVLEQMGFEILEDVIEVINGEPRRVNSDVAKYHYIISKARGDTESGLEQSFGGFVSNQEKDKIIKSLWDGRKVAKEMAVTNAQGEEECKYVYVIVRDASDLGFSDKKIEDDKGKEVIIT
jgi:hypothetical protein